MAMVLVVSMKIRFGAFELDEDRYLLERSGTRVALRPKVFDLLVTLVGNRNRVVRREELVERLWNATSVGAGSLSGLINELRQALGEDGRGASSIRTVHARGYQFVGGIEGERAVREAPPVRPTLETVGSRVPTIIQRVTEQGTCGVVVEVGGPARTEIDVAELLAFAERTGFEIQTLLAPDESMASPARFARQLIDLMIASRGRASVCAALPLPARGWLGESVPRPVAGGRASGGGGPPDPVLSIVSMLSKLSRRRPIVLLIEDVERAGRSFADDLVTLVGRLEREPVLWVATMRAFSVGGSSLQILEGRGGFERWIGASVRRASLDRSLHRLGFEPLPIPLAEAIESHVRGDRGALEAIGDWIGEANPARIRSEPSATDRSAGNVEVCRSPSTTSGPMKTVPPARVTPGLRSVHS